MFDSQYLESSYSEENAIEDGLSIVDAPEGLLPEFDDDLLNNASELGLALGFGDYIADEKLKDLYNMTEHTDRENMELAGSLIPIHQIKESEKSRPFDKFVSDLCKGKISIDDADY